jgi:hypothetical protein
MDQLKKLIIILIASLLLFFYPIKVLQVYIFDQGERYNEVIYQSSVRIDDEVTVKWTHSVSIRPVYETYEINDDLEFDVKEMIFDTYSANLPSQPEGETQWEFREDSIRVYNYDLEFKEIPIVIGAIRANHILLFKDDRIVLKDIYKPGGYVKVRVVKKSLLSYVLKEVI